MKLLERAIITVRCEKRKFQTDLELPTSVPVSLLRPKLLASLALMEPGLFSSIGTVALSANGIVLLDEDCLATKGVWDGGIIDLEIGT